MTNPVKILLGNLKTILSFGSSNANKNVVTDANGDLKVEDKNNHNHGQIDKDGKVSTTTSTVGNVVVTDSSNVIKTINKLPAANVTHQDISGKEDKSNKVTSWSTTTSDTNYPSEKLVKTGLDGKASSTHNHDGTYLKSYTPPTASTSQAGIVQLSNTISSTSKSQAATANAVKTAYDKGNHSHPYASSTHNHDGTYLKSYTPPTGSTSQAGILQLEDSYSSTSTTKAATPNAVKAAYDKGNHSHSSYVNPTIADNLTTNDSTQVLSAKQGKILQDNKLDATTAASIYQPKGKYLTSHQSLSDIGGAVTITKATNSTDNTLTTYTIKQGGTTLTNGVIDIPKKGVDVGTFAELQGLIDRASDNDIIILTKDYKNSGNEDYIGISKPLTIIGNGHIIDGDKKNGIIALFANGSCKFNGIVFVNGNFSIGGAIWVNTSDNIISNCSFINNNSTNGGGLAIASSNNIIHNCEFINNTATNGGAINIAHGSTPNINNTIYNCVFRYNSATDGANIYNSSSAITIYDCHITTGLHNVVNKDSVYIDDVNSSINTHNSNSSAHQDIRNLIPDVSGKADIIQSITNGDTTHSPSADIIYDTLIDSNSTTKNGHTHNYATSNDISSSINTHNSSSSAHQDLFSQYATLEDVSALNHQIIEEIPFYWVDDFLTYASSSHNVFYDPNNDVQYLVEFIDSNDNDSGFTSDDIKTDRLYQIPYGSSYAHDICVAFTYDENNEEYNAHYVTTNERYATLYELSLKANSSHSHSISDLPTASLSDGDTTHIPTCDTVYDALASKSSTGHSHDNASSNSAGFMSSSHYTKLNNMSTTAITINYVDGTSTTLNVYHS